MHIGTGVFNTYPELLISRYFEEIEALVRNLYRLSSVCGEAARPRSASCEAVRLPYRAGAARHSRLYIRGRIPATIAVHAKRF